jgi:hypothetical protein
MKMKYGRTFKAIFGVIPMAALLVSAIMVYFAQIFVKWLTMGRDFTHKAEQILAPAPCFWGCVIGFAAIIYSITMASYLIEAKKWGFFSLEKRMLLLGLVGGISVWIWAVVNLTAF